MSEQYSVDWFIRKFEAIPQWLWTCGDIGYREDGSHCALGHCCPYELEINMGFSERAKEAHALESLLGGKATRGDWLTARINDGHDCRYKQDHPKFRILAALHDIKAKQSPPPPKPRQPVAITPVRAAEPLHHEAEVQSVVEGRTGSAILPTGACSHIWLDCGVCMICSATKPVQVEVVG